MTCKFDRNYLRINSIHDPKYYYIKSIVKNIKDLEITI